jgi:hypothetical protein
MIPSEGHSSTAMSAGADADSCVTLPHWTKVKHPDVGVRAKRHRSGMFQGNDTA